MKIRETLEDVRKRWNPRVELLGILPSQVVLRRRLSTEVIDSLREELGDLLLNSTIRDNVAITESTGHARSVLRYDRSGPGAEDFRTLAEEICERLSIAVPCRAKQSGARAASPSDARNSQEGAES